MNFPLIVFRNVGFLHWRLSGWMEAFLRKRTGGLADDEREDFGAVLAATLTLLGLIVGLSFPMGVSRYNQRKNYEEAEANAISTKTLSALICPRKLSVNVGRVGPRRLFMKSLFLVTLLLASMVAAQTVVAEKPCISFVPESTSLTNMYAMEPLKSAVMLSGDFEFYASGHAGCWGVHVLSLPVISGKGKRLGYAISHTITDPKGMEVGHALTFGPDHDIFVQAMHKAAADAIRNIRLVRSASQSSVVAH